MSFSEQLVHELFDIPTACAKSKLFEFETQGRKYNEDMFFGNVHAEFDSLMQ